MGRALSQQRGTKVLDGHLTVTGTGADAERDGAQASYVSHAISRHADIFNMIKSNSRGVMIGCNQVSRVWTKR